jgi:hypothetical protein
VEAPSRRGAEPLHPSRKRPERAIDQLEELRAVRIRLEETERFVEPEERPRMPDAAVRETLEQLALLRWSSGA